MKKEAIKFIKTHYLKIIVIVIIITIYISNNYNKTKENVMASEYINDIIKNETIYYNEETTKEIVNEIKKVDIKGQIIFPGVYTFDDGDRIIDVVEKAGGFTEEANTTLINLSKKLTDEMMIYIKSKDEVNMCKLEEELFEHNYNKDDDNNSKLISINYATKEELMILPGIGESKAIAIIDYREKNKFQSITDIINVKGIGENLFEKIKEYITV
ncbi:MAG TPA: hypothetical protein GX747_00235 [Tenericutes bacterium]|nr:hypothetical protein [Mycoplasmatota bacterium]